jgi:hypothetical protein
LPAAKGNLERVHVHLRLLLGSLLMLFVLGACEDDAAYKTGQALPTRGGVDSGSESGTDPTPDAMSAGSDAAAQAQD